MRGEIQGLDECILATIADLEGLPLAQVRGEAIRLAGLGPITWQDVCRASKPEPNSPYWTAVRTLCDTLDPSKTLFNVLVLASRKGPEFVIAASSAGVPYFRPSKRILPRHGKGVIVLTQARGIGHIVPWENGLAYDTNRAGVGETLSELRGWYGRCGFRVNRITVYRKGNASV